MRSHIVVLKQINIVLKPDKVILMTKAVPVRKRIIKALQGRQGQKYKKQ